MIFIAEIGLNHNGNFGLMHDLVRQAANSGADIAKFQLGWRGQPGELNHITEEVLSNIVKICEFYKIEPMLSIFTVEALEMARAHNFKRFKIASRTVTDNQPLVEKILDLGQETFVSLGFWQGNGLPFPGRDNVRYLWCRALYPTPPWKLDGFPKDFNGSPYAGFSDHTVGIETALLAIARGARVIEKHFTLDKSDVTIRDHALSSTPDEFAALVRIGRDMRRTLELGV